MKNKDTFEDVDFEETAMTLRKLIPEVTDLLSSEPALVYKDSEPVIIVGELHGNSKALYLIIEEFEETDCSNIVFLGGYLDRENHSFELLKQLFELKIKYPDRVVLLQGRHELANKNDGTDVELLSLLLEAFKKMPVAAIVNGSVFCINCGVPGGFGMNNLRKGEQSGLLSSDPFQYIKLLPPEMAKDSETFGRAVYEGFMYCYSWLKLIVQSHSSVPEGYKWWYDGKLLSIYSAPVQDKEDSFCGAFVVLKDGELTIYSFGDEDENGYHLTDVVRGPYWHLLYKNENNVNKEIKI
ncbi:metallophosphoesterase [Methanolobus psychrotolerans]|uniref:metallophosphoesterase n=1 Tax=Methanolobus psychrotolerans TaxID=1874706 RepID=UPI00101AD4EB|nr:metallophosphoesterase [Methanolobus psychrotolerans]